MYENSNQFYDPIQRGKKPANQLIRKPQKNTIITFPHFSFISSHHLKDIGFSIYLVFAKGVFVFLTPFRDYI